MCRTRKRCPTISSCSSKSYSNKSSYNNSNNCSDIKNNNTKCRSSSCSDSSSSSSKRASNPQATICCPRWGPHWCNRAIRGNKLHRRQANDATQRPQPYRLARWPTCRPQSTTLDVLEMLAAPRRRSSTRNSSQQLGLTQRVARELRESEVHPRKMGIFA